MSTRRPTGTIIAPPIPCTKRDTTNAARLVEAAQSSDPLTNTTLLFDTSKAVLFDPTNEERIA